MGNIISWITTNQVGDERQGEARQENASSLWGMVYTLIPTLMAAFIYLAIFLFTRRSQRRFYAPRTYLGCLQEHERSPELPDGLLNWCGAFWKIPDLYVLKHQSLDAYLFLRYLRVCTTICFVSMCVTWPILFPLNATGGNGKSQLEMVSYSNINLDKNSSRLYAHAVLAWVVYGYVVYTITREYIFYINLRQAFLLNPQASNRISSRTVLFTCVPKDYLDEARIRQVFGSSVKNVWISGNTSEVARITKERDSVSMQLEQAEVDLVKEANSQHIKTSKRSAGNPEGSLVGRDSEMGPAAPGWVSHAMRPAHRLGLFGLFGKKVDTIGWSRAELERLIPKAEEAQSNWKAGYRDRASAVFVEYNTVFDAQVAFQVVTHHQGLSMSPKYLGIKPDEVIWRNLEIPAWQIVIRQYVVYTFVAVLIVFWAVPVGIVGIFAQLSVLQSLPFLKWIDKMPDQLLGIISGLLPSAVLSLVMSIVPGLLQFSARVAGVASQSQVELFVQNAFFLFQLVQVFLIRTITDTASAVMVKIVQSPTLIFSILAESLPTSSNFYISYFIIQGLTIAIDVMTKVVSCIIFNISYTIVSRSPRDMYRKWTTLSSISWGSTMPVYTGMVIISITYAVIAPLLLLWATIGIGIFYQAYRYNILFVSDTKVDTHGLIYPRALKQLFTGIYLAEICLIGMFLASKAIGQAGLIIVLLIFTILHQIILGNALDPLLYSLPLTLQSEEKMHGKRMADQKEAPPDPREGNFVVRYLKPWVFADYWALRKLVPEVDNLDQIADGITEEDVELHPYCPPSVTNSTPLLWIPEDAGGVSKLEIAELSRGIPITDEGCTLDRKNRIVWDTVGARPPIWEKKIYY